MARETENAANSNETAAKAGANVVAETATAGSTVRAADRIAAEAAERIENASKGYGAAMEAAFRAVQDYNTKLVQVFQTNAEANLQLGQTLMQTRSPTDFADTMSKSLRERTELIVGQAKELAALRQEATKRAMEAIAVGR